MSVVFNHLGILDQTAGNDNKCCDGKKVLLVKEWCWDEESPAYNVCGKSANLKVTAFMTEQDRRPGDARIVVRAEPTFTPAGVVSDTLAWSYSDTQGTTFLGTGQFNFNMIDLIGEDSYILKDIPVTLTGATVTNGATGIKKIRLYGTLTPAEIDTLPGTFFMVRKNLVTTGLQYNPKEIVFYKQAISNITQKNGYIEFDYNVAFATNDKLLKFWLDQTIYKLNNNFFGVNKNTYTYNQIIKYNLVYNTPTVTFTRTITFRGNCEPKIITKTVSILDAIYPFTQTNLVNYPVSIRII
jgi:hypothetical protein